MKDAQVVRAVLYDGYLFANGLEDTVLSNGYKPMESDKRNGMVTLW